MVCKTKNLCELTIKLIGTHAQSVIFIELSSYQLPSVTETQFGRYTTKDQNPVKIRIPGLDCYVDQAQNLVLIS